MAPSDLLEHKISFGCGYKIKRIADVSMWPEDYVDNLRIAILAVLYDKIHRRNKAV
jgi:hypothetical protein